MIGLIMACWDGWSIAYGLLHTYFLCDVCGASKDIIESIYEAVERGDISILEDFSINFFRTFVI